MSEVSNKDIEELVDAELSKKDISSLDTETLKEVKKRKNVEAVRYSNFEQSRKIIINAIYGAYGNEHFHFFSVDFAEAVTTQGKEILKFSEMCINEYFKNFWHKDTELHEKLGLEEAPEPITENCSIYMDTDSVFFTLHPAIKSCGWEGDAIDFSKLVYENRLEDYFNKCFDVFAEERNTENLQKFELESIAYKAIWPTKKKYVQDLAWKDGKEYNSLEKIAYKGLEVIKSQVPSFCRDRLNKAVEMMFLDKPVDEVVNFLYKTKEQMRYKSMDEVSQNVTMNNYEKYVLEDTEKLRFGKNTPTQVKASGLHNYLLRQNKEAMKKYKFIKSGDKVRWYYCKGYDVEEFAFLPGAFPVDFAPDLDVETQFKVTILKPFNRLAKPAGYPVLNTDLVYTTSLF